MDMGKGSIWSGWLKVRLMKTKELEDDEICDPEFDLYNRYLNVTSEDYQLMVEVILKYRRSH